MFRAKFLAIIDSTFPQEEPKGFRNSEINLYLSKIKNAHAYMMHSMKNEGAWYDHGYGVDREIFEKNFRGYLRRYPENRRKVHYLTPRSVRGASLAYSFFLAETYTLLPFFERNRLPFIFVLYPGGAFGVDFEGSDKMLKEIFTSELFRGVIATQPLTHQYLLDKEFCSKEKIHYIYGGFVQFSEQDVLPRKYFKRDKETLDICFVANKYSENGKDKGFDLFSRAAEILISETDNINFHVVGDFDQSDSPVAITENTRFKYYGIQSPDFLKNFYSKMDIFLSPNRNSMLYPGNFDGFPLGGDSSVCGVARFVTNPMGMETPFKDDRDIVVIKPEIEDIVAKVMWYYKEPSKLIDLAISGQRVASKIFDRDLQAEERIRIFSKHMEIIRNR